MLKEKFDFNNYKDKRYGRLIILALGITIKYTNATRRCVVCQCDCGKIKEIILESLKNGNTTSCGCLNLERVTKHGHASNGIITSIYNIWHGMIQRCRSPNNKDYPRYGGRGIVVCDRWIKSFENFYADMGDRPSLDHSIDRMNNDGNYEPSNCKWSTKKEQSSNRKNNVFVEYKGISKTTPEWSREFNIPNSTIRYKLQKGIAIDNIFNTQTALV